MTAAPVCRSCLQSLEGLASSLACSRCGLPFEAPAPEHGVDVCGVCRLEPPAFDVARGFGVYEGNLRRLVHLLKYDKMRPLAKVLAGHMAETLKELDPVDLILPVPLHHARKWHRGFNQSDRLAQELSRVTGIPYERNGLRRVRDTQSQAGLSHRERRINVKGAFQVRRRTRIEGLRVLVVDDVMTTGATADACASALKAAGAVWVAALTAARAQRRISHWSAPSPRPVPDAEVADRP